MVIFTIIDSSLKIICAEKLHQLSQQEICIKIFQNKEKIIPRMKANKIMLKNIILCTQNDCMSTILFYILEDMKIFGNQLLSIKLNQIKQELEFQSEEEYNANITSNISYTQINDTKNMDYTNNYTSNYTYTNNYTSNYTSNYTYTNTRNRNYTNTNQIENKEDTYESNMVGPILESIRLENLANEKIKKQLNKIMRQIEITLDPLLYNISINKVIYEYSIESTKSFFQLLFANNFHNSEYAFLIEYIKLLVEDFSVGNFLINKILILCFKRLFEFNKKQVEELNKAESKLLKLTNLDNVQALQEYYNVYLGIFKYSLKIYRNQDQDFIIPLNIKLESAYLNKNNKKIKQEFQQINELIDHIQNHTMKIHLKDIILIMKDKINETESNILNHQQFNFIQNNFSNQKSFNLI